MNIPSEFKGKVYFYWNTNHDFLSVSVHENIGTGYILLGGSEEIHVKLSDGRAAAVEALERQIKKEQAESEHRLNVLRGKIQNLLALEVGDE